MSLSVRTPRHDRCPLRRHRHRGLVPVLHCLRQGLLDRLLAHLCTAKGDQVFARDAAKSTLNYVSTRTGWSPQNGDLTTTTTTNEPSRARCYLRRRPQTGPLSTPSGHLYYWLFVRNRVNTREKDGVSGMALSLTIFSVDSG